MWPRLLAFLIGGGVLGTGFGVALGFFLFPFVFPPAPAAEQLTELDQRSRIITHGTFIHANKSDPVHWGKGTVTVRGDSVFLGEDFEVGPGPKFHVYLVPKARIRSSADLSNQRFVDLGRLRSFRGSQRYPIPASVNLTEIQSIVIWCERFAVLISPADLVNTSNGS